MATRYFCDNCGNEEEMPIRVVGSKDFYILCKNCWEQVKEKLVIKKESSSVNQR